MLRIVFTILFFWALSGKAVAMPSYSPQKSFSTLSVAKLPSAPDADINPSLPLLLAANLDFSSLAAIASDSAPANAVDRPQLQKAYLFIFSGQSPPEFFA